MSEKEMVINIFGDEIEACCFDPLTGYFRDGFCNTDEHDYGSHVVCAVMTDDFLEFSKSMEMIYQRQDLNLIFLD